MIHFCQKEAWDSLLGDGWWLVHRKWKLLQHPSRGTGGSTGESSATYVSRFTQLTEGEAPEFKYGSTSIEDIFVRKSDGMECVMIPAARARIGNDGMHYQAGDNEGPSHEVELDAFLMDIEPVCVGAYARFLNLVNPNQDQLSDWCILPEEDRTLLQARICYKLWTKMSCTITFWYDARVLQFLFPNPQRRTNDAAMCPLSSLKMAGKQKLVYLPTGLWFWCHGMALMPMPLGLKACRPCVGSRVDKIDKGPGRRPLVSMKGRITRQW